LKINVYGLGVVGLVTALRLCENGFKVQGIDISKDVIDDLLLLKTRFYEPHLLDLLRKHLGKNFFPIMLNDSNPADVQILCVGTPILEDGEVELEQLESLLKKYPILVNQTIIIRSTVPPGTLDSWNSKYFLKGNVLYYPEFLRQGSAWKDSEESTQNIYSIIRGGNEVLTEIYTHLHDWEMVEVKTAEYIKYMNNTFHAVKVSFINEMSSLGARLGVNTWETNKIFLDDKKLNISKNYLRPGMPFGGHCLTKELQAVSKLMKKHEVNSPLMTSVQESNKYHLERCLAQLKKDDLKSGFIGLGFKSDTGDMRDSPLVDLYKSLPGSLVCLENNINYNSAFETISFDQVVELSQQIIISDSTLSIEQWKQIIKCKKKLFITNKNIIPSDLNINAPFSILGVE
jgi:GDP-mannose 6-dehydrogenase